MRCPAEPPRRHTHVRPRISPRDLELTLRFGRRDYVGDGTMYVVGRRELADPRLPPQGA